LSFEQYQERLAQFQESFTEEETDTFARSLVVVGEMVAAGFGEAAAAACMAGLHKLLVGSEIPEGAEWREQWLDLSSSGDLTITPAMKQGADLHAFAYYGVLASWQQTDPLPPELEVSRTDVPSYIESTIALYKRFMGLFGEAAPSWGFDVIGRTILAAQARLKVDQELPMTVHELAALSRVASKRVQNAIYAGSDGAPVIDADGLITPSSARQWLDARDYLPSLWQSWSDQHAGEAGDRMASEPDEAAYDFLFVPEAADGSLFAPSCGRGPVNERRYMIGEKGRERPVADYDQALTELARMVVPKWRRPNAAGNWGVVRAERWRRVRRADLQRL
jgi:hypothetical protein